MRSKQLPRDFLFFLFALYSAQGWLYPTGSIFSKACIVLIIFISGVYLIRTLLVNEKKSLFYIAWTLLIILNIIGFIFNPDLSEGPNRDMFKQILGCMLPFYPFYYFAEKGELKANNLIWFFIVLIPILIINFYSNNSVMVLERGSDNQNVVNNRAYSFVSLIPFVFLIKKRKILSGALMAIFIMFIIQGAKRGAIIAGAIGLIMYFFYQIKTVEKHNWILNYLITFTVIIGLAAFAYKTSQGNVFMINRMTSILEGSTSGRDVLYGTIFTEWFNSNNIWNLLFGFGFAGSLEITGGNFAHNDWFELLSNFGLTGILAYLFLFYAAVKSIMNHDLMTDKRYLLLTIIIIWFFITLVSMWYTSLGGFKQAILFGYLLGSKSRSLE